MKQLIKNPITLGLLALCAVAQTYLHADNIRITVVNTAPEMGTSLTPVWIGFHDGTSDTFDVASKASDAIERIAEDGNNAPLRAWFKSTMPEGKDLVLTGMDNPGGPPLHFPQRGNSIIINLDGSNMAHRYMSFVSMILPSNDAFIGNDDPMALPIYDNNGNFVGGTWDITGDQVLDAGTEINDETPSNVPMLGQMAPNSGTTENGMITNHPGFMPNGAILSKFPKADFNSDTYSVVRIMVEKIPENHASIEIEITNTAPAQGTLLTPFWLGLHDGSFDHFNVGEAATMAVERVAEDGNPMYLAGGFSSSIAGGWTTVATGPANPGGPPLFFQGQSKSQFVNIDLNNPAHQYFSFMSMILPSNDAFIGNEDPMKHQIIKDGKVVATEINIMGSYVWDAGSEDNDEAAQNVPVLGQMAPNTGTASNGVVAKHPGFNQGGAVLAQFPAADFLSDGYTVATIKIWERFNPWSGIPFNDDSMRDSPTFGIVDDSGFPWVTHKQHGSLYFPRGGSSEGFWIFNSQGNLGWIFTSENYYPRVYRQSDETWYLYQKGTSSPRVFENIENGELLSVD